MNNFKKFIISFITVILCLSFAFIMTSPFNYTTKAENISSDYILNQNFSLFNNGNEFIFISKDEDHSIISKFNSSNNTFSRLVSDTFIYDSCSVSNGFAYLTKSYITNPDTNYAKPVTEIKKYNLSNGSLLLATKIFNNTDPSKGFCALNNDNLYFVSKLDSSQIISYNSEVQPINLENINISYIKNNPSKDSLYITDLSHKKLFYLDPETNETTSILDIPTDFSYEFIDNCTIVDNHNNIYKANFVGSSFNKTFNTISTVTNSACCMLNNDIVAQMDNNTLYKISLNTGDLISQYTTSNNIIDISYNNGSCILVSKDNQENLDVCVLDNDDFSNLVIQQYFIESTAIKTQDDIRNFWNNAKPTNTTAENVYEVTADIDNFSNPGKVSSTVISDALNAVNFYRKAYNLPDLSADQDLCLNAQFGAVLALVNNEDISSTLKPINMSDSFYSKALTSFDKNCIQFYDTNFGYMLPQAVHDLFNNNYEFRDMILNKDITTIGFGAVSDTTGKTAVLINPNCNKSVDIFSAYPINNYPYELVNQDSSFSLSFNSDYILFGNRGTPKITVSSLGGTTYTIDESNSLVLDTTNNRILFNINNILNSANPSYTLLVEGLYNTSGAPVEVSFKINLFQLGDDFPLSDNETPPVNPDIDEGFRPINPSQDIFVKDYIVDNKSGFLSGITPLTTISTLKKNFMYPNHTLKIINYAGKEVSSGIVGTNMKLQFIKNNIVDYKLTAIIYGDLTGEGNINSRDTLSLSNYLLHKGNLSGAYLQAADINHDGDVKTTDLLALQKYINGIENIQ